MDFIISWSNAVSLYILRRFLQEEISSVLFLFTLKLITSSLSINNLLNDVPKRITTPGIPPSLISRFDVQKVPPHMVEKILIENIPSKREAINTTIQQFKD